MEATIYREIPAYAAFYGVYEGSKRQFSKSTGTPIERLGVGWLMLSGSFAGATQVPRKIEHLNFFFFFCRQKVLDTGPLATQWTLLRLKCKANQKEFHHNTKASWT